MTTTTAYSAKRPTETEVFAADFANLLATGETILTGSCAIVLASDSAESDIAAMKTGSATVSGAKVSQKITGGTDGTTYTVIFTANTSNSQVLQLARDLPVVRDQT